MIFLVNREYILWECVELSRLHIQDILKAPVEAKLDLGGEKISPEFFVDADACKGIEVDQIKEVIRHAYADCKEEMERRLKGCNQTRDQVQTWLHGGMSDGDYYAMRDPAATVGLTPQSAADVRAEAMADHLLKTEH